SSVPVASESACPTWLLMNCLHNIDETALLATLLPIVPEGFETPERLAILRPVGCLLAGNNVIGMTNGEPVDIDMPAPGFLEPFNSVRGEDQVKIEGPILQLHEILSAPNLAG